MIDAARNALGWSRLDHAAVDRLSLLGPTETATYVALLRHTGEDRTCWPSMARIAEVAGVSLRRARAAVAALVEAKLVERETRQSASGVTVPPLYRLPPFTPQGQAERNDSVARSVPGDSDVLCRESRHDVPGEQETEKKTHSTRKRGGAARVDLEIPAVLDTAEFRAVWEEWIAYRRERRLTTTTRTASAQLAKLAEWGPAAAIASIEDSIRSGWQGIFQPTAGGNGRAGRRVVRQVSDIDFASLPSGRF